MLLIKNARVVDPATNTDAVMDILIDQGMIIETGDGIEKDCEVIDASGLTAAPGLMDAHVHLCLHQYLHLPKCLNPFS